MPSSRLRFGLAAAASAGLGLLAAWLAPASAGQGRDRGARQDDALQVLADVVLIEARCRSLAVDYGKLFGFAESQGLDPVDVMPTGPRRAAFEAATRSRERQMGTDQLCDPLAADRAALIPGLFSPR